MTQPPSVSNIGIPQCPHCLVVPAEPPAPLETLGIYLCLSCEKTYAILGRETSFTTFPLAIDPNDLHQT